ncbi:MAG: response regulator [Verrucomicrobia bacterium]|nr:response regulator [Verrucomicrobiota bacterium]
MTLNSSSAEAVGTSEDGRKRQVMAAQVRLLYGNANLVFAVTLVAASILGRLQWEVIAHPIVLGWCLYMFLVAIGRFTLARRYRRRSPSNLETAGWCAGFVVGTGFAGTGWGAAGILLYPESQPVNELFLIFMLGGMMLGAAPILAARPEAYRAFLIPAGLAPTARLALCGDETHLAMALMAGLFTLATLSTTRRIHLTIASSLNLQFENAALVEKLQAARQRAEALNEQLERRVQARTAELHRSTQQLQVEITQREQIEEQLLRARKLESLRVLAGGIAHDFNNFLAVVQGNVELAKARLNRDAPVQAILDEMASACKRAAFLSSQLLTFSKGGAPVRRLVSLAQLIMDAVPLARAGAQTRFDVHVPENLRSAEVDPGQIGQVLHNVLLNARQAMSEGGTIEVRAENVNLKTAAGMESRVRISIRDHGAGIPDDVLPHIFDPYFTTKPGGSGLGLATAYAIITKHGGNLSVQTKLGDGTVFTIDLPASEENPEPQAPLTAPIQTGTGRLLVMDDEEAVRKVVVGVLTTLGYEVQAAGDGAEAIVLFGNAKACGRDFDAVVLDLTVSGGMGGLEAAARLRELDPLVKLIVSSGYSDAPVLSDLGKYGFDDLIPKPWTIAELSEVVRRVLQSDSNRHAKSSVSG